MDPFLGEIKLVSFDFAPQYWASCDGQLMMINQNQALFVLIGTTYGGDGRTTFALPDLKGRAPMHRGAHPRGEKAGTEMSTAPTQLPQHTHPLYASADPGNSVIPTGNVLAATGGGIYGNATNLAAMNTGTVSTVTGGPHENMQPFLVLHFIIALSGIFPSRD
jgi:microcystin-dependent protein